MVFGFLDRSPLKKIHFSSSGQSDPSTSRKGSGKPSPCDSNETEYHVESQTKSHHDISHVPTGFPTLGVYTSEDGVSDIQEMQDRKTQAINNLFYPLVFIILLSWGLGAMGSSWAWLLFTIGGSWAFVRSTIYSVTNDSIRFESLRLHRRRALQSDETCEWLNLLLNRWWVFSSASIFSHLKTILDPRLQEAKPAFVETINLKHLSLGDRTPLLRGVRSWDASVPYRPSCSLHTPSGLALAPTHALAVLCDLTLDSDSFSAILAARIGHKGMGVDLDVGVEHLVIEGRVIITLFMDSEAQFPHVARLTFSFTERPRVSFKVKLLKSVQMMEVPVLKTWIHNLVTDALATAWVDPGQLEVNIHSSEAFVPEHRPGDAMAVGVITVILRLQRGISGSGNLNTDEDKWVVVGLGDRTHISTPFRTPLWQYSCSFLLLTPLASSSLVLKVKTKRLITTTLTQFDIPFNQYGLEINGAMETILHKKGAKVMGGNVPPLHVRIEYTPLSPISLEVPIPQPQEDVGNGAGVLYIMIHGADNLVSADASPSPYCLVFNSRKKVKTTHYVSGSKSPRWECSVEMLVSEVASVCITFVICSLPRNPKLQDGELLGIHTLNLSTVGVPLIQKQFPLHRNLSTPTAGESSSCGSTLTASIVFRCVPSVSGCSNLLPENPNFKGMPLPMPMTSSSPTGSPCLITGSSPNIGPSVSPTRLSSPHVSSMRRGSTGVIMDQEDHHKKKSNTHWLHHAKHFLGSGHDSDGVRRQDVGDILASGLGLLELTIVRASDLVARDLNGFSDPYCVVKVNGEVKYRTRVKKKTLDPFWNESLMTHLPKKDQFLVITLWDHDAFGMKDFLGSLTLKEDEVRRYSSSIIPVWCKLDGVKTGTLEVKFKLISEDYEFESGSRCTSSVSNVGLSKKHSSEDAEQSSSRASSLDSDSSRGFTDKIEQENVSYLNKDSNEFSLSLPNRSHSHFASNSKISAIKQSTLLRASSNPSLGYCHSNSKNDTKENKSIRSRIDPLCTPSRTRKSGAEIIASALAIAKARSNESLTSSYETKNAKDWSNKVVVRNKTLPYISMNGNNEQMSKTNHEDQFELESIHPISKFHNSEIHKFKERNCKDDAKDVPKISLNDQSEDEYGLSEGSGEEYESTKSSTKKKKKIYEGKRLRAVKDKVCRGFSHPLRRFKSEASVHLKESISSVNISLEDIPDSQSVRQKQIHSCTSLGVGGGEGDASELLASNNRSDRLQASSQPNLAVKPFRSWTAKVSHLSSEINSVAISGSFSSISDSSSLCKTEKSSLPQKRAGATSQKVFPSVRGVLRRIQGLHVVKTGRQLFVRIRISEERGDGRTTIKTVGRSRLVPSSSSPVFECEWGLGNEVSEDAQIILEIRTSSRDLISSTSASIAHLFNGYENEEEADIEQWVNLEGGAQILLKAQFGGDVPLCTKRRSLFRSWSLHRIGKPT